MKCLTNSIILLSQHVSSGSYTKQIAVPSIDFKHPIFFVILCSLSVTKINQWLFYKHHVYVLNGFVWLQLCPYLFTEFSLLYKVETSKFQDQWYTVIPTVKG